MKRFFQIFFAIMAVVLFAFPLSAALGTSIGATAVGVGALSFVGPSITGVAFAGLNKEIWLPDLLEGFYADDMFLSEARDMSAFVDNNAINLAEAGVDPDVLINTSYPMNTDSKRTDTPLRIELDTYDTENTRIENAEEAELAYDKRSSIIFGHKQALRMKFMEYAAYNFAPATDSEYTPVIATTGGNDGNGNKALTWKDIRGLQTRFDNAEVPQEGRVIVLSQQHLEDLETEDLSRFNKVMDKGVICTFKIYKLANKRLPRYNRTSGAKVVWGAAAAPSADVAASFAFHKNEVMKARGDADMFAKEKDPHVRGDIIGFQMRGVSMPIRNKGIAAIYSPIASDAPILGSITPDSGQATDTLTLSGVKFTGATAVNFGSTAGTNLVVVNDTTITIDIPAVADNEYDVTVVTPNGTSNSVSVTVHS